MSKQIKHKANFLESNDFSALRKIKLESPDQPQPLPELKVFNPLEDSPEMIIPKDPGITVAAFGMRRSGKTVLMTFLMSFLHKLAPTWWCFTGTKQNCYWEQFLNPKYIVEGYNEDILQSVLEKQKEKVKKFRDGKWTEKRSPCIGIIWDDCLPVNMQWDGLIRQIYFNGRHVMIINLMNSQHYYSIPSNLRGNIDFVFMLMQDMARQIEGFNKDFLGMYIDYDQTKELIDKYCKDRGFIVVDQSKRLGSILDRIYYGKAPQYFNFFVGDEIYWANSKDHLKDIIDGKIRKRNERTWDYGEQIEKTKKKVKKDLAKKGLAVETLAKVSSKELSNKKILINKRLKIKNTV